MSFRRIDRPLVDVHQGYKVILTAWRDQIKPALADGQRLQFIVRTEKRGDNLNRHFHWQIGHIAAQDNLMGKRLPAESWKRLLIDAFRHETQDDPDLANEWRRFGDMELLPALNHPGFVMVGEQSREFSAKLARSFITWLYAYGAERGVRFPVFEQEGVAA